MIPQVEKHFLVMEESRHELLGRLKNFTHEQLSFRPAVNAWSMLEVIQHVMLVEQAFLRQAEADFESIPGKLKFHPVIGSVIVWAVFAFNLRVKMPIKGIAPAGAAPLDQLVPRWEEKRTALKNYLETVDPKMIGRPIFVHPISGPLNIVRGVQFLKNHFHHHVDQIERIQRSINFPKT